MVCKVQPIASLTWPSGYYQYTCPESIGKAAHSLTIIPWKKKSKKRKRKDSDIIVQEWKIYKRFKTIYTIKNKTSIIPC